MSVADSPGTASLAALANQIGFTNFVIKTNTKGLSHEDSLIQPAAGGNCLNWVLGHIVAARNGFMELLGLDPIWSEQERETYKSGGPPLSDRKALAFDRLLADLDSSQALLSEALGRVPAERLGEKAPFSPTNNPEETVGSLMAGLVFHDAYHAGQTGLLRRMIGKEGAIS